MSLWLFTPSIVTSASQGALEVKNLPANAGDTRDVDGFDPWVRKIPWKRAWQPTLVFLSGKSHGQRSLVGYSPQGHKESDMTERLTLIPGSQLSNIYQHVVTSELCYYFA